MEKQINEKIIEIVQQANKMIPVEWDDLYIVIEMDKTYSGEAYFYFKYKNHYHYHLEMPEDFGLSMMEVLNENTVLFEKSEELKKVFVENDLADWYICIIHLDEDNKLSVDFDYAPWLESDFGPTARMNFFRYKFLGFKPRNEKELEQFKAMGAFQREHNGN
ncbi:immunity protein YezG family protein [Streptococcus sp. OMI870]|uniref:immunity protein YezG family protein n=1 Tax=Streptococcus sp. OMI870 TaxID=3047018 RepID=UPI0039C1810C